MILLCHSLRGTHFTEKVRTKTADTESVLSFRLPKGILGVHFRDNSSLKPELLVLFALWEKGWSLLANQMKGHSLCNWLKKETRGREHRSALRRLGGAGVPGRGAGISGPLCLSLTLLQKTSHLETELGGPLKCLVWTTSPSTTRGPH